MKARIVQSIICALMIFPMITTAQYQETLSDNARVKGGFGGPFFLYSKVADNHGGGAGGGGAFIVNNMFVGAFGQGETFGKLQYEDVDYYLSIGYGGLWVGYVVPSHKLIHLYTSVKVGWGGAILSEDDDSDGDLNDHEIEYEDAAFVIHPEAGVELNVARWFRIAGVGGYRFMNGVNNIPTFQSSDFDSPSFSLVLRFGGFGYGRE